MTYPYAAGDLLERPNTYFYSAYHGRAFLDAWRRQRADALREMDAAASLSATGLDSPAEPAQPTDLLLESIHRGLSATGGAAEHLSVLDRLVQRFEVTKRIHAEYSDVWRPVDGADYRSAHRYVRFAEVLELAYERTGALPYLNALLKNIDTLSSLRSTLSQDQRARVRRVIARERDHVRKLAERLPESAHAP